MPTVTPGAPNIAKAISASSAIGVAGSAFSARCPGAGRDPSRRGLSLIGCSSTTYAQHNVLWLWVPACAGTTLKVVSGFNFRSSLRAQRSNPFFHSLRDGLLRCARNDGGHTFAFSRLDTPESCLDFRPQRGRRECRAPDAPAAACARVESKKAHALVRSHRHHPAFPAQWFTAYFVLSPVIGLFCHRHRRSLLRRLDASVEASGPHDFAVRFCAIRQRRIRVHRIPSRVRDDRDTPLEWDETHEL
jgi:hypothetical protein